jgi:molybdopterin converting factor small subunit
VETEKWCYNQARISMSIEIFIPPLLQPLTNETSIVLVEGTTVRECLNQLIGSYPALKPRIYNGKNELISGLNIFVNKENTYHENLARIVLDGDTIYLSYPVTGG